MKFTVYGKPQGKARPRFTRQGHAYTPKQTSDYEKQNWFEWIPDNKDIPKIHPTQKPVTLLKTLIRIFTDEGDTVIDPCAGSGSTLRACMEINRNAYGFEIDRKVYRMAKEMMLIEQAQMKLF